MPDAPAPVPSSAGEANPERLPAASQSAIGGTSGKGAGAELDAKTAEANQATSASGAVEGESARPLDAPESPADVEGEPGSGGSGGADAASADDVALPELEIFELEADEKLLGQGESMTEVQPHLLAGIWVQVEGPNTPDFGPGGYRQSILMLNPKANVSSVYRFFRGEIATVVGGELALDAPMDADAPARGTATIRTDPSLAGRFPTDRISLGSDAGGPEIWILPPDGTGPWTLEWERDGSYLLLGDRRYAPIGRDEFENIRRGGADVPTAADLATRIASRGGRGTAASPPNESSFFGIRGGGKRVCLICDISGSMQGPKLDRLKVELEKSIRGFNDRTNFLVIFFDGAAHVMDQTWMQGKADRERAIQLVQAQGTGGGTDPTEAFNFAFGSLSPLPDVVYFMTDGMIPPGIPALVQSLNTGKAPTVVHAISFGEPMAEPIMRQIAKENRGTFLFVAP